MWRQVGIVRDETGLRQAAEQVEFWDRYVGEREFNAVAGWELQNMLHVGRLMIASALARTESRGGHFRSDYPEPVAELASEHIVLMRA
jgi:L-aspartate oxidase